MNYPVTSRTESKKISEKYLSKLSPPNVLIGVGSNFAWIPANEGLTEFEKTRNRIDGASCGELDPQRLNWQAAGTAELFSYSTGFKRRVAFSWTRVFSPREKSHGRLAQRSRYLLLPCGRLKKDGLDSSLAPPDCFSNLAIPLPITSTT